MNISSIVIDVEIDNVDSAIDSLKESNLCEYHLHQGSKIVATIEGSDTEEELQKMSLIEKLPLVKNVHMIYSYCEDHIEELQNSLEMSGSNLGCLNDDNLNAEQIEYNGDINTRTIRRIQQEKSIQNRT